MESNILVIDEGTGPHELLQKLSFPKEYRVLEVADGRSAERAVIKVEAEELLNIGLTTVYRKIEEYGLG